ELNSGTASLRDAYAKWKIAEGFNGKMGRYKTAFFQSGLISDYKTFFLERSGLGNVFDRRDLGLELGGKFDTIQFWAGAQNGGDGQGNEYLYSARVRANLLGEGAYNDCEGAYGAGPDTNLSAGIAWEDDGNLDKGAVVGFEVQLTASRFS